MSFVNDCVCYIPEIEAVIVIYFPCALGTAARTNPILTPSPRTHQPHAHAPRIHAPRRYIWMPLTRTRE